MRTVRIGTRGSRLALTQAESIAAAVRARGAEAEVVVIKTAGDVLRDVPLSQVKGQGFFVKELEAALGRGEVDLAVHSCKDMPTRLAEGLVIAAVPERADPRDCLVSRGGLGLAALPAGAVVASSSLRRKALVARERPDLARAELRGNVDTRLRKLDDGLFDALLVARAALERLGHGGRATEVLPPDRFVPAPAQGALAVEARAADVELVALLLTIDHGPSHAEVRAERALLAALGGGCQVPVGGLARHWGAAGALRMHACIVSPDGRDRVDAEAAGEVSDPEALGELVARRLVEAGGRAILDRVRAEVLP